MPGLDPDIDMGPDRDEAASGSKTTESALGGSNEGPYCSFEPGQILSADVKVLETSNPQLPPSTSQSETELFQGTSYMIGESYEMGPPPTPLRWSDDDEMADNPGNEQQYYQTYTLELEDPPGNNDDLYA
jgi:hypothetical protein